MGIQAVKYINETRLPEEGLVGPLYNRGLLDSTRSSQLIQDDLPRFT